jgi:serine/threonine protein kinase
MYARKLFRLRPDQPHSIDQIVNEVKIITRLRHVHIVSILATYQQQSASDHISSFGIIMHPAAESDLGQFLLENPVLTDTLEPKLRRWCICLINTLAYMHEQDVRHKDIKPDNILVQGDRIYFTDFGLARDFFGEDTTETEGYTQKTLVISSTNPWPPNLRLTRA